LLDAQAHDPNRRHFFVAEATRRNETLVAANDDAVFLSREDRLDDAVSLQAPRERFELPVGDSPGIADVAFQRVDRDSTMTRLGFGDASSPPFVLGCVLRFAIARLRFGHRKSQLQEGWAGLIHQAEL
jgi:hypothetical protein